MKKLFKLGLAVLVVLTLCFAITGCGEKEENKASKTNEESNNEAEVKGSKTYETIGKVLSGENYIITLEGITDLGEGEESASITMAKQGQNIFMDVEAESQHATISFKDNKTYIISHDEEMYMIMDGQQEDMLDLDLNVFDEDISKLKDSEYTTGKETIDGTEYEYEEYLTEEGITERYYFSGNDLKYVKSIDEDGEEELMKITKLSSNVDDSIFNLPENYQAIDANNM